MFCLTQMFDLMRHIPENDLHVISRNNASKAVAILYVLDSNSFLSTKWVDYVEEPMKYQALRPQFFSVCGWQWGW